MVKKYQYDNFGRLSVYTSPSGFKQKNVYDDRFCELVEIRDITTGDSKILWKRTKVDSLGYISQVINGDNRTVDYTYNNRGEYTHIYSPGVIDFLYQYDHRDLMLSRKEKFYTDDLWKGLMSISAMILMKGLLHLKEKEKQAKRFHILPVIGLHQNPT